MLDIPKQGIEQLGVCLLNPLFNVVLYLWKHTCQICMFLLILPNVDSEIWLWIYNAIFFLFEVFRNF